MNWEIKWKIFVKTMRGEYFQQLLKDGLINTVKVAVMGLIIGIIIGTFIAVVKVAPRNPVSMILGKICDIYVALFRGTPMVVQLLIAYYVLLPSLGAKEVEALNVGIVIFGMNSGAYVSEIMRGGINSVDRGQMEAARAVGFGYATSMIKIIVPQAIKNILPTLGNEFISLIKETSVLSFISVCDLYTALNIIGAKNYEKMIPYLVMAGIYIVMVLIITALVKVLEYYFARSSKKAKTKKTAVAEE